MSVSSMPSWRPALVPAAKGSVRLKVRQNILKWRPRKAGTALSPAEYPLWSMCKDESRIDCTIQDTAGQGWSVVFFFNQEWFSSHRFATWAEAIAAADDKHAELERNSWKAFAAD